MQFKSLKIKQELFEEYFRDSCSISKPNRIAFLEANALYSIKPSIADCPAKFYVFVGEKENKAIQKSAKIMQEKLQGCLLQVLPKVWHGVFSINHAKDYANKILGIIGDR